MWRAAPCFQVTGSFPNKFKNMKKIKKYYKSILVIPLLLIVLTACDAGVGVSVDEENSTTNTAVTTNKTTTTNTDTSKNTAISTTKNTSASVADDADTVKIVLNGSSISVSSKAVSVSKTSATINAGGTYYVTGNLEDGQIIVNAPEEDVKIFFGGVSISNSSGSAIYVVESKNTDIILVEVTNNYLSDGTNYDVSDDEEDAPTATIYSMSDLKIEGGSRATLVIKGNYNDAIVSKDDLKIKNADIEIEAKDDGMRGKDSVDIEGSTLVISAGGDGIKSDNEEDEKGSVSIESSEIEIAAGDDGIHGVNLVEVLSGTINISESYEGIEGRVINIYDGNIDVTSRDDALNVSAKQDSSSQDGRMGGGGMDAVLEGGEMNIYGGTVTLDSGGDGFDSNGIASMSGGTLIINGPTNDGNGPIDVNGDFDVTGGTIIAVGSSGMAETPSETSSQYAIQVNFDEMKSAGTKVSLTDSSGSEIFSYSPEKQFQSVVYSSNKLVAGQTYKFYVDGEEYTSLTLDSVITVYGNRGMMGGPGGGMSGGGRTRPF